MEFWDNYELIDVIKKSAKSELRIAKASKGVSSGVDIRTYFEKDGEYIGTKKGLFISADNLSEFVTSINKLTEEIIK
jgi:hypothetical protein